MAQGRSSTYNNPVSFHLWKILDWAHYSFGHIEKYFPYQYLTELLPKMSLFYPLIYSGIFFSRTFQIWIHNVHGFNCLNRVHNFENNYPPHMTKMYHSSFLIYFQKTFFKIRSIWLYLTELLTCSGQASVAHCENIKVWFPCSRVHRGEAHWADWKHKTTKGMSLSPSLGILWCWQEHKIAKLNILRSDSMSTANKIR